MKNILINFAHPAKSRSKINRALRTAVEGLENITVNDLYEHYPDFLIDVEREKALCEAHDIIIFQHPLYWYSTPSIVKEWFDLVLQHGWAYGSQGKALQDKILMQAITAGGDANTYQAEGYNQFTLSELTTPVRATAKLCNMNWLPPFAVMGVHRGLSTEKTNQYAEDYRRALIALRDGTMDIHAVTQLGTLNENLNAVIGHARDK